MGVKTCEFCGKTFEYSHVCRDIMNVYFNEDWEVVGLDLLTAELDPTCLECARKIAVRMEEDHE